MAKAHLAIAAAILAATTVVASAQNYPSYESRGYGGPLYVGPNFHSSDPGSKPKAKSGTYRQTPRRAAPARRKTETAKSAPAESDVDSSSAKTNSENSSIARVPPANEAAGAAKSTQIESSTIAGAPLDKEAGATSAKNADTGAAEATAEPRTSQSVGCKKYFPTSGLTLSVPCD